MSGSPPQRVVEALQGHLDALNGTDPPDTYVPWTSKVFRHPCPASRIARQTGRATSVGIDLHERYVHLWEVWPKGDIDGWAITYREGRCAGCGLTARSKVGRIVEVAVRPPLEGRVAR